MRSTAIVAVILIASMSLTLQAQTPPATQPVIDADTTKTETIDLWPAGALKDQPATNTEEITERVSKEGVRDRSVKNVSHPNLTRFRPSDATAAPMTAVIVIPGGGYSGEVFDREGNFVAAKLRTLGFEPFILKYRLPNGTAPGANDVPLPLQDVERAVRLIRANASTYGVDPHRIGVMGFSAGGHVAGLAATQFDVADPNATDDVSKQSARPDFAVLMYAVSSMHEDVAHAGSRKKMVGEHPDKALESRYSTAERITPNTPPLFLVHATDDKVVKIKNSEEVVEAAKKAGVSCEYTVFDTGGHGFGIGKEGSEQAGWMAKFAAWTTKLPAAAH